MYLTFQRSEPLQGCLLLSKEQSCSLSLFAAEDYGWSLGCRRWAIYLAKALQSCDLGSHGLLTAPNPCRGELLCALMLIPH